MNVSSDAVKEAVANSEEKGRRIVVKAIVFGGESAEATPMLAGTSKAVDPFEQLAGQIVEPPIDLYYLSKIPTMNSELGPCIEAMEVNVHGFGYQLTPRRDDNNDGVSEEDAAVVRKEERLIKTFLKNASRGLAQRISFTALLRRMRKDLETTGNAFWEVLRNGIGTIVGFRHIPAHQVRLLNVDSGLVSVQVPYVDEDDAGNPVLKTRTEQVRSRRYAQGAISSGSGGIAYFKQFGDARIMDSKTGKFIDAKEMAKFDNTGKPMPEERKANEMYHFALYAPWTPYGMPRWYGAMLAALGARSAEEVNWTTLRNNNVPSMVMCVSNGRLTDATSGRIKDFIETHVKGKQNYSQILLVEGESGIDGDEGNNVKIDIKPLVDVQHKDQLFGEYIKNNNDAVRRSFRFSGIFTGQTTDMNRSVSETARRLADEQVFGPEREEFDWAMTEVFFPHIGFVHHKFMSHTPNITDNTELIMLSATVERNGAMTPRRADAIVQDVFPNAARFPLKGDKYDLDVPFSLTMAERIKNQAMPTEVGQQLAPTQPAVKAEGDPLLDFLTAVDRIRLLDR